MRLEQNGGSRLLLPGTRPKKRIAPARLACALLAVGTAHAQAAAETVIHNFGTFPNGANPYGALIRDWAGNLYGTTYQGGAYNLGTVFKLDKSGCRALGHETVLYTFTGGADGGGGGALTLDPAGNLYGNAGSGGVATGGLLYKITVR